ncbi:MAG TPA: choice-of-anchor Q domain-containing protein, partial [Oceanobacillus sp.]|nr:choice-of-anchor Q domain-containing protein [Oceanobacillus sp.]
GIVNDEGTLTISNSIIANNTGGDCIGTINHTGPNYGCGGSVTGNLNLGPFTGGYFPLLSGSVAIDAGDDSICPSTDQRGAARPLDGNGDGTATCDLGSYEVDEVVATATPTVTPTETPLGTPPPTDTPAPTAEVVPTVPPPPPTPLCEDHNFAEGGVVRASIADSLGYAVNCRVLYQNGAPTQWLGGDLYNAGAIGIQGVLDLGVIQAVDIFSPVGMSYFNGGAVFCLRGQGTLIWLAAKNAPRVAEVIGSYEVDDFPGFTCATLFEPGTLVLVRDNPTQSMPPLPAAPQRQTLTNCTVTFDIGVISSSLSGIRAELPATAFVDGGYQVSLNGVEVWLSADLVTTSGDCGE